MKKIINLFIVFVMLLPIFCVPDITHAQTLGDLKNELKKKQNEYEA